MSTNVAELGLGVNSAPVVKAADDLDELGAAAGRAATMADRMSAIWGKLVGIFRSAGSAASQAAAAVNGFRGATDRLNPVMKSQNVGLASLAAQFQDVAVTSAMGMNAFQVGLQQGSQMVMALSMVENPVKALGSALAALFTPLSLITIGLVAAAAALIQWVNWTGVAASVLNTLADLLPQVAQGLAIVGATAAVVFAPQIIAGAFALATAIGGALLSAVSAVGAVVLAIGAIPVAIIAALTAVYIFRDEVSQALGVDVVGVAKTAANLVIGSFVAAYEDLKFLWQQFPNIIGAAVIGAANIVIQATVDMIHKALSMIDGLISSVNSVLPEDFQLGKLGTMGIGDKAQLANPYSSALEKGLADRNAAVQQALNTDYIGAIGEGIAKGADYASGKLKELAKNILKTDEAAKKKGSSGKTEEEKYASIVAGADRRIASLKAEQAAVGLSAEAAARLRYEQDLLNQANQAGITLDEKQTLELKAKAAAMASIEASTQAARQALEFTRDAAKGFLSTLRQGLMSGASWWESFKDAALSVVNKIADALETKIVDQLLGLNSSSSSTSGGGLLGWLFGGLFGGTGTSGAGGIGSNATGTNNWRGGLTWVGEHGKELLNLPRGSKIVPNNKSRQMASMQAGGVQRVVVSFDQNGNLQAYIKREVVTTGAPLIRAGIDQFADKDLPRRVKATLNDSRRS